jgi:hypothetical protein
MTSAILKLPTPIGIKGTHASKKTLDIKTTIAKIPISGLAFINNREGSRQTAIMVNNEDPKKNMPMITPTKGGKNKLRIEWILLFDMNSIGRFKNNLLGGRILFACDLFFS